MGRFFVLRIPKGAWKARWGDACNTKTRNHEHRGVKDRPPLDRDEARASTGKVASQR